jgi:hypothetical protein
MAKVYQPIVIEQTDNIINGLIESDFFLDYEITDLTYSKQYFLNLFTEKYIKGELDNEEGELFTEDEFTKILIDLVTGSTLDDLKNKGFINSYEDDETEETFFLTDKGKKVIEDRKSI